mmetsp:Transcript_15091/g.40461  ORF Transcript_15091/g.40461 Transcript_15091/m.40461 type:complete len:301 (+) Transcript_15091:37-939(+)
MWRAGRRGQHALCAEEDRALEEFEMAVTDVAMLYRSIPRLAFEPAVAWSVDGAVRDAPAAATRLSHTDANTIDGNARIKRNVARKNPSLVITSVAVVRLELIMVVVVRVLAVGKISRATTVIVSNLFRCSATHFGCNCQDSHGNAKQDVSNPHVHNYNFYARAQLRVRSPACAKKFPENFSAFQTNPAPGKSLSSSRDQAQSELHIFVEKLRFALAMKFCIHSLLFVMDSPFIFFLVCGSERRFNVVSSTVNFFSQAYVKSSGRSMPACARSCHHSHRCSFLRSSLPIATSCVSSLPLVA